jgi:molecular chaperone Hsp33
MGQGSIAALLQSPAVGAPTSTSGAGLVAGLAARGSLRWVVVDLTLPLEEVRRRLDLSPISSVALGRALAGVALLRRVALKVPAKMTLAVDGDGPLGRVVAEAVSGAVRGLVGNPRVATPEDGSLDLAPFVGRGSLQVSRETGDRRYSSQVELVSGEIGDDLVHYLEQSEQIRSAVLLGVLPRPTGIAAAGGLIVEALPGTPEEVVESLEENLRTLEGVSRRLERGGLGGLQHAVLSGFDVEVLETAPLAYRCSCDRGRLRAQLAALPADDLESLFAEAPTCRAECAYCGQRYEFAADELRQGSV